MGGLGTEEKVCACHPRAAFLMRQEVLRRGKMAATVVLSIMPAFQVGRREKKGGTSPVVSAFF